MSYNISSENFSNPLLKELLEKLTRFFDSIESEFYVISSTILQKDGAGNEFRTSNSTVITSVIDEMKRTLDVKVKEVEEMISL